LCVLVFTSAHGNKQPIAMKGANLIKALGVIGASIAVQQILLVIFAFKQVQELGQGLSWSISGGTVHIAGREPASILEFMGGIGMVWGTLAGLVALLLGGWLLFGRNLTIFALRGFSWKSALPWLGVAVVVMVVLTVLEHYIPSLSSEGMNEMMRRAAGSSGVVVVLLAAGLLVPVFEELVFRGILYSALDDMGGSWLAVVVTSLAFAFAHMQYGLLLISLTFLLGLLFALLRRATGSVWPGVLVHVANNSIAVLMALYAV